MRASMSMPLSTTMLYDEQFCLDAGQGQYPLDGSCSK